MSRSVLLTFFLCPLLAAGQDHTPADLAVQARAVLEKHCIDCHGPKPSRSTLKILDHTGLTAPARPVPVFSGNPKDASLALDLIKEGSMPPGALEKVPAGDIAILEKWLASGAVKYPVQFDDEFAHRTILDDIGRLGDDLEKIAQVRYLSLFHVAARDPGDLGVARREFLAGLKNLIHRDATILWVDPTATICRIDVKNAGWGSQPFFPLDDKGNEKKGTPVSARIFDLVLLEYPHAVIPQGSKVFPELARRFLVPADQVRPIPFVRGDWFVANAMDSGLTRDLRLLIKRAWSNLPPGLDREAGKPPPVRPGPPPGNGVLLPAHDAWYGTDDPPAPDGVKGLTVETVDPTDKKKDTFKAGDTFKAWVAVDPPAHVQYVYWSVSKVEYRDFLPVQRAGKIVSPVLPNGGFVPVDQTETEYVRALAAPDKFPDGDNWGIRDGGIERFVHPFFKVNPTTGEVDLSAAKVARKTMTIRIVPKK